MKLSMKVPPEIQACRRLAYAIVRILGEGPGNDLVHDINQEFGVTLMRLVPASRASDLWQRLKGEALALGIPHHEIEAQKHELRVFVADHPARMTKIDALCAEILFLRARWRLRMDEDAPDFPPEPNN